MSFPASWKCFYCSNPINDRGRHVYATIEHCYVTGGSRESDRRFHPACFEKFKVHGRPYNPRTEYIVLEHELIEPESVEAIGDAGAAEALIDLAKQNKEADFRDLARAFGVPQGDLDALWSGTVARVGRAAGRGGSA